MAVSIPAATEQIDYADLYARWERGNWCATEIDFTQDRHDWEHGFTPEQRRGALWLYSLFFHGEDAVADNLSPYIDAAPLEEQKYFLATQQVDEARHAVFFHRFMHEVVGVGDGSLAGGMRATAARADVGPPDAVRAPGQDGRRAAPRPLAAQARRGGDALPRRRRGDARAARPAPHRESLEALDLMPGFREGIRNVALDEQRHIAFGVRLLADLYEADPRAPRTRSSTSSARSRSTR